MTHCPACRCPLCPRLQGLTPCSPQGGGGHACGALPASCAPALDVAVQLLSVPCFVRHLRSNASRDRQIQSSVADSWRLGPRSAPLGTQELRSALRSGERRRGCFWWPVLLYLRCLRGTCSDMHMHDFCRTVTNTRNGAHPERASLARCSGGSPQKGKNRAVLFSEALNGFCYLLNMILLAVRLSTQQHLSATPPRTPAQRLSRGWARRKWTIALVPAYFGHYTTMPM